MHASRCSELLERFLWLLLLACGSFSLKFDPSRQQFSCSRKHALYCVAVTVVFAIGTPAAMVTIYHHVDGTYVPIASFLIAVQLCFMYLFMIIVNVTMLVNARKLCYTLNALFALRSTVLREWNYSRPQRQYAKFLFFKVIFVDMALLTFSMLTFYTLQERGPTGGDLAVGLAFFSFRYLMTALVNVYLVGLKVGILIQGSINRKLASFARAAEATKGIESMWRQVYLLHCKNTALEKQFMSIINLPVLLLNCWYFFMIVVSAYYMYTATIEELKLGLGVEDIVKYVNPVTFFLYLIIQLYYMVSIPALLTERSKQMLPILGSTGQRHGGRMERLGELITLDYIQTDYSVNNYGMYELNRALLFGIIATVTSYVIILVQFHIQEYG
uniref:Gustatory receptor n=1 Tax=Anopheles dirus TaxID=7168 RepID=A0A182NQX0_9DIPT